MSLAGCVTNANVALVGFNPSPSVTKRESCRMRLVWARQPGPGFSRSVDPSPIRQSACWTGRLGISFLRVTSKLGRLELGPPPLDPSMEWPKPWGLTETWSGRSTVQALTMFYQGFSGQHYYLRAPTIARHGARQGTWLQVLPRYPVSVVCSCLGRHSKRETTYK